MLADLRAWFFSSIEPLAAGRPGAWRSGDLLARVTADIGTLEEAFAGVALPPIAAAAAVAFGCVLLGLIQPLAGWVLLAFAVVAGLPCRRSSGSPRRTQARARIARARLATTFSLDAVRGVADLAAFDRDEAHRARLLRTADALDAATARLATIRAAASGGARC